MFEQIRHQLMKWIDERRQLDVNVQGLLVSSVAKDIQMLVNKYARRYRILAANNDVYEIFSAETARNYVVCVNATCWTWQQSGIPCPHALAVSINPGDDPQTYAQHFFRLDVYRATYGNAIFPSNFDAADSLAIY